MTRSQIAWIYWSALAAVAALGTSLLAIRGGPLPPGCESSGITATVLDLVKKNAGLGLSTFELDDIVKTGEDAEKGTISCAGTVWAYYKDTPYTFTKLTYTIEREPDGKTTVRVEGIAGLRKSILP